MLYEFHIVANAALGRGLSGGDRIFIELSRNLEKKGHRVMIYVWEEGYRMCQREKLNASSIKYKVSSMIPWKNFGFAINYLARIFKGVKIGLTLKLDDTSKTVVYSASDFWMDSLPGWILKMRFPKIVWIGTFYLAAPNPFFGFREDGQVVLPSFKNTLYYLMQKIPYFLIRNYADLVCVTSEPDVDRFPTHKKLGKHLVIKGGVDLKRSKFSRYSNKIYSAVFQGRFHEQKGVLELIEIWRKVVDKLPNAKLAMIGDGPLMTSVKLKIKSEKLEKNITLFGYLFDGPKKYQIFKQSQIVVHPAIYDSGGMAPAEAMAFGLPGVSFDLEALKSYYPKGMLKAKIGDLDDFISKIIKLLEDRKLYQTLSHQAIRMIKSEWSWENRTSKFLDKINEVILKNDY